MPFAVAALDLVIIFIALCLVALTYAIWVQNHQRVLGIPIVGGAIHDAIQWFVNRNEDMARWIINHTIDFFIHAVQTMHGWIGDIAKAVTGVTTAFVANVNFWVTDLYTHIGYLTNQMNGIAIPGINALQVFQHFVASVQMPDIYRVLGILTNQLNQIVFMAINDLRAFEHVVTAAWIPDLYAHMSIVTNQINQLIFPDLAALHGELNNVIGSFGLLVTRPITGLMDRVKGIEGLLNPALPLGIIASLSIPLVRTLVKVAEDPCYCVTQGSGQDLTWYAMAEALDLT